MVVHVDAAEQHEEVLHQHLAHARIHAVTREIAPETILLVSTGLGYIAGLSGLTMPAFLAGCTLVLEPELEADKLLHAFGMTECEGYLSNCPSGPNCNDTIGKPADGTKVRLVDADGFYTFVERKHETIIHGGSNVGPHGVEDVIDSYSEVRESCVVGIYDAL